MSFVGEQVTLPFACQCFDGLTPLATTRHRIDGCGTPDRVGLMERDGSPRADRCPDPRTVRIFAGVEASAGFHRCDRNRLRHRWPDDAIGDTGSEGESAWPEGAQPDVGLDRAPCGQSRRMQHAGPRTVDGDGFSGEQCAR
jgi:hypothetical protein